jgi:misacylated tRNA(Ala) deacylase
METGAARGFARLLAGIADPFLKAHPSMATTELFRDDAYLKYCPAKVIAVDERGIQLDQTVFYPLGGGQAGDSGKFVREDGSAVVVSDTRRDRESDELLHLPANPEHGLMVGDQVTAEIDWERRYKHMRFHTATHLLCAVVPFSTNGCSITADYARLDFATGPEQIDKELVQRELDRLAGEDHAVRTIWVTDEELAAKPELVRTMSVKPPTGMGRIRLLEIDGVDLQACGGTHVKNINELGRMIIAKVEKISATNRRIRLEWA